MTDTQRILLTLIRLELATEQKLEDIKLRLIDIERDTIVLRMNKALRPSQGLVDHEGWR